MLTGEIDGKPCLERNWKEYFAQLVGTIISIWDAAALDIADRDGEVIPTFINLTDASIKVRTLVQL
jgi:CCR4-NOT transcriptional complex subunit CAF120